MKETVLIYIKRNNQFLMLYRNKKKNDINGDKYIGVGGHIEEGETPEQALVREVKEETGLTLLRFQKVGIVHFSDTGISETMHLYISDSFSGSLIECDEGDLSWIDIDKISSLPMWEGDYLFLDKIIQNKNIPFEMTITYSHGRLVEYFDK